jgi:hypothetical protein
LRLDCFNPFRTKCYEILNPYARASKRKLARWNKTALWAEDKLRRLSKELKISPKNEKI